MKTEYNVEKEFADRISDALAHYGLGKGDIGKLIGTGATDIKRLLNLERSLGLKRANKISAVFGMKYYQFGDPQTQFLPKNKLPKQTIEAINYRMEVGPSDIEINTDLDLPMHTMEILRHLDEESEFTPNAIYEKLPTEIKSQIQASRITVLFKTGSLSKYVEYTNKKEVTRHIYKFKSAESKIKMEEALMNKN